MYHQTYSETVYNEEEGGFIAKCSCGWKKVYPNKVRARAGASGHFRMSNKKAED